MGRFSEIIENSDFTLSPDTSKEPDRFAADQELAGQTGLPVDYVERNRDEAQKIKKQNIDFSKFADMELGASLTDPTFSNLAQDDLDNLSYLEKTFKGLGTAISESFKQGVKGIALSAMEDGVKPATSAMMPGVYDPFISDIYDERMGEGFMAGVQQSAADVAVESIEQNEEAIKAVTPEGLDVLQQGIRSGVQSLAQMAPGLAASIAARSSVPMLTSMGAQSYGGAYAKARSEGLSPEQSASYGMIDAAVEVATEKLPADKLLKITGEFGNQTLRNVVKFMVVEAGTEQIATFLQSLNALAFGLDEELEAAETAADQARIHAERAAVTLIATVVAGGAQAGIAAGAGKAAEKLSGGREQIHELVASAEQSNLKRRAPEQFRSFLQSVDPNANIFVPASAFDGVELDPSNKTLAQVAAQLPQARALNGDVVIPVADVLTDIPADMFATVAPFVRVEADGVAEIDSRPDMKELIEQVNRESEMATQSKAFQESLSTQLVDTARARPEEATKYAAMVGARLETLAVDKGMTFDEAVKEYIGEFRVVGPEVELTGDRVMEQAEPEGYEASAADDIRAKVDELQEAGEYDYIGLRVLPESQLSLMPGDTVPPSYVWDDGNFTDEELGGASAINIRSSEYVDDVISEIGASGNYNKTFSGYPGRRVALIASNMAESGADPGEIVMADAIVIAVYDKESSSIGPGGGLLGVKKQFAQTQYSDASGPKERGLISISDQEIVIKLTDASNLSTFIHEAGHLFLEIESRIAAKDGISTGQRKMLEWLGVKSFDQIKVEQHEKFARGFEAYAMEGRAPSKDLVEVFRSFARWLKKVYANMKQLDVELNDDIRQFFDRMLAADQAVKEAERLTQYKALFKDAKSAGMTEQEFADYTANQLKAQAKGGEELQAKLLRELTRQAEKWWKEELKAEKEKAAESLGKEPLYQATSFLTGKTKLEGFDVHKMDIDAVKAMLPEGAKTPKQLRGMLGKNGLHPDEVAAMFDYPSGAALVIDIITKPTFNASADAAAKAAMIAKHGDILNDGTLQQEAQLAAHNEERGKLILAELRALSRRAGKETINRDALKFAAKEVIGRTPLKDVHPGKYRTAEVRSAKEAATALTKKDYAAAAQAKLKQAANFYLYREAMDAKQKEQSWRRYLAAVPNRKYSTKDVHPDYIKQMRLLASVYDFRRNPDPAQLSGIGTWIKAQQDVPDADVAPQVLDVNLSMAMEATAKGEPVQVKNYRDMTLDELQGVYDMVKHLRWVGGQLSENEKELRQQSYEKVAASIEANAKRTVKRPRQSGGTIQLTKEAVAQYKADYFPYPDFIERFDGFEEFGDAFKVMYSPVIDSTNKELKMRRETAEKAKPIFSKFGGSYFKPGKGEITITTDAGNKLTLDRRGRLMVALYNGSQYSRDVLMQGDNLTQADINKILAPMTNDELDLVESIWEVNESFWPEIAAVSKQMTGVVPEKREIVPFSVNGRVMKGGYMKLAYMYDTRDSHASASSEDGKITRTGDSIVTQTKHGARTEVVGSGGRRVALEISTIFKAWDEAIHDVAFAKTARDTMAALRSKEISGAIERHYGKEVYESMLSSLSGIIAGNATSSGYYNRMVRHFRTASTYSMLGYSIRNLIQQPGALPNIMNEVGVSDMSVEMFRFYFGGGWNDYVKNIQSKSEFMAQRASLVNRDTASIMANLTSGVLSHKLKEHAFDLQTLGDAVIAYPGWTVAYKKALARYENDPIEIREKKAITLADETISKTIGSGLMKDLSPMLQGGGRLGKEIGAENLKSLTFMGSYMAVVGRMIARAKARNDYKTVRGATKMTREMAMVLAAPALLSALLVGSVPDTDDDETWLGWFFKESLKYGFSTVFGLRDFMQVAMGYDVQTSYGRAVESIWRGLDISYDISRGEKEITDPAVQAKLLRAAGSTVPLPSSFQIARSMEYVDAQHDGNEGEFNMFKMLVVGKDRD